MYTLPYLDFGKGKPGMFSFDGHCDGVCCFFAHYDCSPCLPVYVVWESSLCIVKCEEVVRSKALILLSSLINHKGSLALCFHYPQKTVTEVQVSGLVAPTHFK
jgi:hypothetical protein